MSEYLDDSILDPNEYDQVVFDDGRVYIYNSESEEEEVDAYLSPEDWISENEAVLQELYTDFKEFPLGEKATYSDLCEYIYYGEIIVGKSDIDVWISEATNYAYKMPNLKHPSMKEFAAHYFHEIIDIYTFLDRNSDFCIGPCEDFIDFLYINSDTRILK